MPLNLSRKFWLKLLFTLLVFAGFFFFLGFFKAYHLPQIKSWALNEIEIYSKKNLPVHIQAKNMYFNFLPLGVILEEINVSPQSPANEFLAPISIESVSVRFGILALLKGQARVSQIQVNDPQVVLIFRENPFKQRGSDADLDFDFDDIYQMPFDELKLNNLSILARFDDENIAFRVEDLQLTMENRYKIVYVNMSTPHVQIKQLGPNPDIILGFHTRFLVEKNEAQISAFRLTKDTSFLIASGRIHGDLEQGNISSSLVNMRSSFELADIENFQPVFFPEISLPKIQGLFEVDGRLSYNTSSPPEMHFNASVQDLVLEDFLIGNMNTEGSFSENQLKIPSFKATHDLGSITINDFTLNTQGALPYSAQVDVHSFDLQKLFQALRLHEVPVFLKAKGQFPCQGEFSSQPYMKCNGKISGSDLLVHSGGSQKVNIIEVDDLRAEGEVLIDAKKVQYETHIWVGQNSHGSSSGSIEYQNGFEITYKGDHVDFADIKNLAQLEFEGTAHVEGTTKGDSRHGVISMAVQGKDFWFEDYALGNIQSQINYKNGVLSFKETQGRINDSRYQGVMHLYLLKNEIYVEGNSPYVEAMDLKHIFSRKVDLPFSMTGAGSGEIKAWGPFQLSQLNYNLRSSLYRGSINGESFDEAHFNVSATNGHVTADKVQVLKASSSAQLNGKVDNSGHLEAIIVGRNFRLEQSETLQRFGLDLTGHFDFTMSLNGFILEPDTELQGRLARVSLADQPVDDSNFRLKFSSDRIEGQANLMGQILKTEFTFPLHHEAPFAFRMDTDKWDFTNLFSLVSSTARQQDFETRLSSKIELSSPHGGVWQSTGQVEIQELSMRRGPLRLQSKAPISILFQDGVITTNNFDLEGGNNYLRFESNASTRDRLNANLNANLDMSLLSLFTPFLADLRGQLSLSTHFEGGVFEPKIAGSAFIENGLIRLNEFPHPFENIRADILFNQQNILLNSIRSDFATGSLTGDGRVQLLALDNIPVDIKGRFQNININFPEGMRSRGTGNVMVTGHRFPYQLKIEYQVNGGEVTTEFGATPTSTTQIQPSTYLPRFISRDNFQPITLDLDIQLVNPIPIRNSLVESPVRGHILVQGSPAQPRLRGTITPQVGGNILFRDVPFEISTGYVEYLDDAPDNPRLYLTAMARVAETTIDEVGNQRKEEYDITLLVQGRAQNPQITLTSQPPLMEQEIVSLLALGITSTTLNERQTSGQQAATSGAQIGAAILQRPLSKEFKDRLGVDLQVGADPENVSVPRVTFSKQWTPKLGASASRTIDDKPKNSVRIEYRFNRNFSAIGSWETKERPLDNKGDTSTSVMGLDLEYRIQFR